MKNNRKKIIRSTVGVVVSLIMILQMTTVLAYDQGQPAAIKNQIRGYTSIHPNPKASTADNILVSNTAGDDVIPGITKDASGHTVVTWTNEQDPLTWNMGIAYSSAPSDPASWTGWTIQLTGTTMVSSSDTAYVNGPTGLYKGLYGVQLYYDTAQLGCYEITDITTDPSTWTFLVWNRVADNPTYAVVEDQGYYSEPYNHGFGPANMYIYHEVYQAYDIQDCPTYWINDIKNSSGSEFFDAQSHLWTAPAKDPAMAMLPHEFHLAWQYHNATTDKDQIVWKRINSTVEADIEFTPFQAYVAEGTNPRIAAYQQGTDTHVAVVYVNSNSVNCVYSSDDGTTWSSPVTVAAGSYPALCSIGTKLFCAYVDQGNLYLKTSEDGGATWSAAVQINDQNGTVSAEEKAVDIHAAGIVWVDTRGADKDIYYAATPGANNPPSAPIINGPASGKIKQQQTYTFQSTDPESENVSYYIDWGDNTTSGWLGPYTSGVAISQTHTWTKKATYIIKAKAKDSNGGESSWSTLQVSMPYQPPTHPFLTWLFERFPNAFPILRHILGF